MKHAALLATGLVGAVLLIQGTGSILAVPGSSVGGVTFAATSTVAASTAASLPLALPESSKTTASSATSTAASSATSATTSASPSPSAISASDAPASGGAPTTHKLTTAVKSDDAPASDGDVHTQISSWSDCPAAVTGSTAGAPGDVSVDDIPGTSTADMNSFANEYNALRTADCLQPVPFANIRFSSCLEQRLFWMADDPSSNPYSAWGHTGVAKRSDGVPIVGCDGDLAGGSGYTGADVAQAWWISPDHQASLYQPAYKGSLANVCIYFALTHGGYNNPGPNEPYSFTRAAAYWGSC